MNNNSKFHHENNKASIKFLIACINSIKLIYIKNEISQDYNGECFYLADLIDKLIRMYLSL
ncbi:hypothetical protein BN136_2022 [Cronobacter universalis NCTC 9529]|uniref:Uncharacterized protein n=1 Tax=Cronobacter universalis NCTC 9529 TaxID=1074000 RepID=A0AAC8ZS87_9ENTR|nr:hypothetical protein AFK65_16975 [Cronobacter universalis NCTC 9529]CCK16012.1 hypothetical protein BN136_2022 [Cronobacter universalis NCTC 9529]